MDTGFFKGALPGGWLLAICGGHAFRCSRLVSMGAICASFLRLRNLNGLRCSAGLARHLPGHKAN